MLEKLAAQKWLGSKPLKNFWLVNNTRVVNDLLHARALLEHARKIGRSKMARLETARKFLARTRSSNENFGSLTSLALLDWKIGVD